MGTPGDFHRKWRSAWAAPCTLVAFLPCSRSGLDTLLLTLPGPGTDANWASFGPVSQVKAVPPRQSVRSRPYRPVCHSG